MGRGPAALRRLRRLLPEGSLLPEATWQRRHHAIVTLVWLAACGLLALAVAQEESLPDAVAMAAPVAVFALLAQWSRPARKVRTMASSAGLIAAAGLLVHVWDGRPESYFAFFVVIGVLALYQDWMPFVLALGFVVFQTAVLEAANPLVYGAFVLAASAASIASWRANEQFLREPLTGLPGRAVFNHKLDTARSARPSLPVTVILIDLDHFKGLNDSRGHRAGDELLSAAAVRLSASVRPGDVVARIGGDEFAVLCEGLGATEEALAVAERIKERLRVPFRLASEEASISASLGVAVSREEQDSESLLRAADAAMYRAKSDGGDRCCLFDEAVASEVSEQYRTETDLRRALEYGRIEAQYQPVVSLSDGAVVGWEALARWQGENGTELAPQDFIAAAEASGLIVPLGETMLRQACAQLASHESGFIAVNVSDRQLQRREFPELVAEVLEETGVAPERLCLEITETVLVDSSETPERTLAELKAMGVKLALDDFGTGQSSLSYLRRLPLDIVKLDRSFIEELDDVGRDVAIVSAVLDMALSLEITVVAEGVETEKQAACLRALDCDLAQGFLFAPAAPRLAVSTA